MKRPLSKYFWVRQALFCSVILLQHISIDWLILWSVVAGMLSVLIERKENAKAGIPRWEAAFVHHGVDVRRLLVGFALIPIPLILIGLWLVQTQIGSNDFGFFFGIYCFFTSMVLSMSVLSTSQMVKLANASK